MRIPLGIVFFLLLTTACRSTTDASRGSTPSAPPSPAARESSTVGRPPLRVVLEGPGDVRDGQVIEVVLRVERRGAWSAPVELETIVPRGAVLVEGPQTMSIEPTEPLVTSLHLRLRVDHVPAGDLVVTATAKGPGWGVRAEKRYAFGRAPAPSPLGPELKPDPPSNPD